MLRPRATRVSTRRILAGESPSVVLDDLILSEGFGDDVADKTKDVCRLLAEFFYLHQEDIDVKCVLRALTEIALMYKVGGRKAAALQAMAGLSLRALEKHLQSIKKEDS